MSPLYNQNICSSSFSIFSFLQDLQDGNGDSDKNPYISVDFENNLESCLEAANMMEDEGYKEITPFILEDEGKSGTYTWEYVRQHSI